MEYRGLSSHTSPLEPETGLFAMIHYTNLYRANLGSERVIVKTWRSIGMGRTTQMKFKKRLERELTLWQTASTHPNIASFIGLTPSDSAIPALILPEYRQGNVNEYISRCRTANIYQIICGVASGLQYLHSRKPPIVHGKVQGSNILISDDGEPLLSDLGVRNLPYPVDLTMANTRESMKEVRWMAPELINTTDDDSTEDPYPLNPSNDVHSFGMTTLEIITRRPPFANRRQVFGVIMDLTSGIRPARPQCPEMTDGIWDLVTQCWIHEPGKRPTMEVVASWTRVLQISGLAEGLCT